ncbi:hypothetical protein PORY_000030 [Pneumocystis oryctolagi]|uniref:Uncharacterized protein n=1 Tax=Pneumocystis oryctolagi TaxID=42067 RepID=A0ACB7CH43_9ASCO|nr:hypothetical protein PORY_000030 [Pneumocystis oryctolagi]
MHNLLGKEDFASSETLVNIFSVKKNRFSQVDVLNHLFLLINAAISSFTGLFNSVQSAPMAKFACLIGFIYGTHTCGSGMMQAVCYALGIYLLNLFLAFLTPKLDLSLEQDLLENENTEVRLPIHQDEEFRPFIRRLPEFKFWYSATRATIIAFVCSWVPFFDIPVFWPILLMYFCILFAFTMRRQIKHMIKYKYVPFDIGKKRFSSK